MKTILRMIVLFLIATRLPQAPAKTLAIFDFKNTSGQSSLNYLEQAVPQMLLTDLMAASELTLIERAELKKIIEEHQLNVTGLVDEKTAAEIGKISGADFVLFGTIFSENQIVRLDARICATKTAQIIIAEKVTGDGEIIDLINELANRISQRLINQPLAPGPVTPDPVILDKELLGVSLTLDNPYKLVNSTEPGYLLVEIKVARVETKQDRVPLNIALVLDKSGSMSSDHKLKNAQKAALFLVEQLKPFDFFSLITYDTHVSVPVPIQQVTTKKNIEEIIQKIEPGSSTNLSGGLLEGYAQVDKNDKSGQVNRVLLLSDGLANTGITNPLALKEIASKKNRTGITLSTFGVGNDFNEDLMTNLAEFGGANYYFIANPDEIASIFSNELQGLLTIVAQNLRLVVEFNPECNFLESYGYPAKISGSQVEIKLNDIFSDERKTVLLKFTVPAHTVQKVHLGRISLSYDDVVRENHRIDKTFAPTVEITGDRNLVAKNQSALVSDNIALFESTKLLDEAIFLVDQQNFEAAQEAISRNISFLEKNLKPAASRSLKKQYLNVLQYQSETDQAATYGAEEMKLMQKRMKFDNYLQKKKK